MKLKFTKYPSKIGKNFSSPDGRIFSTEIKLKDGKTRQTSGKYWCNSIGQYTTLTIPFGRTFFHKITTDIIVEALLTLIRYATTNFLIVFSIVCISANGGHLGGEVSIKSEIKSTKKKFHELDKISYQVTFPHQHLQTVPLIFQAYLQLSWAAQPISKAPFYLHFQKPSRLHCRQTALGFSSSSVSGALESYI